MAASTSRRNIRRLPPGLTEESQTSTPFSENPAPVGALDGTQT